MKTTPFKRKFAPDYKTSGNVIVTGRCTVTGKEHSITVKHEELEAWLKATGSTQYIQDLMPSASAEDREFLISSTSPEGWATLFDNDEEELVPLAELDNKSLEAIANLKGGNEVARREAVAAQAILDERAADKTWGRPAVHFRDV